MGRICICQWRGNERGRGHQHFCAISGFTFADFLFIVGGRIAGVWLWTVYSTGFPFVQDIIELKTEKTRARLLLCILCITVVPFGIYRLAY